MPLSVPDPPLSPPPPFHQALKVTKLSSAKSVVKGSYNQDEKWLYRVSIKSFPDYKHLLQENYVEYITFLPVLITILMHNSFIL
jgi:hypothetical protein